MIDPIPAGLHTFYTSPYTIREQEADPRHNSFGQAIVIWIYVPYAEDACHPSGGIWLSAAGFIKGKTTAEYTQVYMVLDSCPCCQELVAMFTLYFLA